MVFLSVSQSKIVFFSLNIYIEATVGDNTTSKPGMLDIKGKYKWEAWNKNNGTSKSAAQQEYIAFVQQLKSK
jgi:diazepam-binding inhibitor (GABA receptor modulating acyl-CoA-binding protein)